MTCATDQIPPPKSVALLHALAARNEAEAEARRLCAVLRPRQAEVLALVGKGLDFAEVARHLKLGKSTVDSHMKDARALLGVGTTIEAVVLAVKAGLV